ncbi:MAG: RuvB, partial [uncultured Craurococcus sp.]
ERLPPSPPSASAARDGGRRPHHQPRPHRRGCGRGDAPPPGPGRLHRPAIAAREPRRLHPGRPRPRRGARPRPAARPARPWQDDPGADRRPRAGSRLPRHLRPHPAARRRPGGDPHQPAAPRRALRRRDPPPAARAGGDPLSRDGGFPARPHHRRGPGRPHGADRPAALHPGRRDDPGRPAGDTPQGPLRHPAAPAILHAGGIAADRHPWRAEAVLRLVGRRCLGDRPAIARHAPHRRPIAAPGAGLRQRRRHRRRPRHGRWRAEPAGGGQQGAGRDGPPLSPPHRRAPQWRPGRRRDAGRGAGRGAGHAGGCHRALPDPGGPGAAHPARPDAGDARLDPSRTQPARQLRHPARPALGQRAV